MLNEAEAAVQLKKNGTAAEKVDQALSVCCEWVRDEKGEFRKDCYRCCYWDENDKATLMCPERLMKDAACKGDTSYLIRLSFLPSV